MMQPVRAIRLPSFLQTRPQRRMALVAAALAVGAAALGSLQGLGPLDQALADRLQAEPPPPSPRIVIIGIDDYSLAALGRWPWTRLRHAELLEHLVGHRPRAIGLDLIFSEPGTAAEDAVLADVVRRAGNVVLPVIDAPDDPSAPLLPVEPLAKAAAALGRIDIEIGGDGIVRGVHLGADAYPHFAVAMDAVARGLPASRELLPAWQQREQSLLAFRSGGSDFRYLSYADVLANRVAPGMLEGASILVGVTGTGMGDAYPTPGLPERGLRPGVDILASALDGLASGHLARTAPPAWNALANALPVVLASLWLLFAPPTRAWLGMAGVALGFLGLVAALRSVAMLQVLPLAGLIGIAMAYVLWNETWLKRTLRFLRGARGLPGPAGAATLDSHIGAFERENQALVHAKQLLEHSIDALPDSIFVTDARGRVLVANAIARREFPHAAGPEAPAMEALLAQRFGQPGGAAPTFFPASPEPVAGILRDGASDYLVKRVPRTGTAQELLGWVVTVVDVRLATAQDRLREESLGYLSHDMRAPQTSILNLVELRRLGAAGVTEDEFLDRVGRLAEKTLSYADGFIQLARAESADYSLATHDLLDIATEVADELWPKARSLGVAIDVGGRSTLCPVDRSLVSRALQNLLDNALQFSPRGSRISCNVAVGQASAILTVRDHGPGVAGSVAKTLFTPFGRAPDRHREGAGLGLAFVRTVARRHGGEADAANATDGPGAIFSIRLPMGTAQDAAAEETT
jgi:CHASE2 domain-containing sensor protein